MNKHLCDTNVVSELMRRNPFAQVADWLVQQEQIYLSVVTVEEIIFGLKRKQLTAKLDWFERFMASRCTILEVDAVIARRAGERRGALASVGKVHSQADMLIAATAWAHDCIVVTRNTTDFNDTGVPVLNPFAL